MPSVTGPFILYWIFSSVLNPKTAQPTAVFGLNTPGIFTPVTLRGLLNFMLLPACSPTIASTTADGLKKSSDMSEASRLMLSVHFWTSVPYSLLEAIGLWRRQLHWKGFTQPLPGEHWTTKTQGVGSRSRRFLWKKR